MGTVIGVKQPCKSFVISKKQNHVLRNVDPSVHKGEFITVMGPNGSGKSTLLYTISGMDHVNSGTVGFDHKKISRYNKMKTAKLRLHEMNFIFQQMHFLNSLSIYDNIVLPDCVAKKREHKEINAYADELLRKFQITSIVGHNIQEAGDGEPQRAYIARVVIDQPQILLTDEPTGALNNSNAKEVTDMFLKIYERGTTILIVTRDMGIASYARRVYYINDGEIESNPDIGILRHADELKERERKIYNWLVEKG